jgi:ABC-type phosphate/phosphonate transport system substrate-binding protein
VTDAGRPFARLGMYPFAEVRPAYDRLWAEVHRRCPWTPALLDWVVDVHESWRSPHLVVGQACGWPLVTQLRDTVRVVGAFAPDTAQGDGITYRSVIVARAAAPLEAFSGAHAAINGADSLSGWVSLVTAVEGVGGAWTGAITVTGAHLESLRLVREGAAAVASIDSTTLAMVRRDRPHLLDGVVQVGEGPRVPSLPVITSASTTDEQLAQLRAAFAAAVAALPDVAAALLVRSFEPLEPADYLTLLALTPAT